MDAVIRVGAALLHAHYSCEYNGLYGVQDVVFTQPVRPVKGAFRLTEAPGLGLEVNEAALEKRMMRWR